MIEPSFDKLLEKVDSKYTLVVVAAKRARLLMGGAPTKVTTVNSNKAVTLALHEIAADKLNWERTKAGIK